MNDRIVSVRSFSGLGRLVWLALLPVLAACPKDRSASADCKNPEKYQSRFGVLNAPHYALATILDLNTATKKAGRLKTLSFGEGDVNLTTPVDATEILANTDFTITADADVPVAVKTAIQTEVNSNTLVFLRNSRRRELKDPLAVVTANGTTTNDLKRLVSQSGHVYVLIDALILADEFRFKLKNAVDASADAKTLKFGDYSVKITYACEGSLNQTAKQAGLFFKLSQFQLDSQGNLALSAPTIDLKDYDLTDAIMIR